MREKLINLLESFGYPVHLQGSLLSVDDYPDSFFTFWNFQNDGDLFYDNESHASDFGYWIYFYSLVCFCILLVKCLKNSK